LFPRATPGGQWNGSLSSYGDFTGTQRKKQAVFVFPLCLREKEKLEIELFKR